MARLRPLAAEVQDAFMEVPATRYAKTSDGAPVAHDRAGAHDRLAGARRGWVVDASQPRSTPARGRQGPHTAVPCQARKHARRQTDR